MVVENEVIFPRQYQPEDSFMKVNTTAHEVAVALAQNELVVWDNGTVYALVGNANDPDLQENIVQTKGEGRGAKQPVGWTVPFSHALDLVDIGEVRNESMRELLQDPHELTRLLGGIAFIRAKADMNRKNERAIPDSIIPNTPEATVQIYSPNGSDVTSKMVRTAMALGVEPVMTSANVSGSPEVVTADMARQFASRKGLLSIVHTEDADKLPQPLGSYPVLGVEAERFVILRSGCFDPEILKQLLADYPVEQAADMQLSKYPDQVLTLQHLTELAADKPAFKEFPYLKGAEMRLGLLALIGWNSEGWQVHRAEQ